MSTANSTMTTAENREKLKSHMAQYSGSSYVHGWAELWNKGNFLPWDRGSPSPALADTLVNHSDVIGHAVVDGRRKRALVPGCGRGVDVLLLASFGYDVVGLEYAEKALQACKEYVEENEGKYPVHDEKVRKGDMKFLQGDFYSDEWLKGTDWEDWDGRFDLIYDYTVSRQIFLTFRSWSFVLKCHGIQISTSRLSDLTLCATCTLSFFL